MVYELNRVIGSERHLALEKLEFEGWVSTVAGIAGNVKRLCDGGFYTQRIFKTAIAKPVL